MNVAFIGTGGMGLPMARNLRRAGHAVTAWNRTRAKADPLAADGVVIADTVSAAVRDAEVAVTMLADDHAAEEALTAGILEALPRGAIHAGMSTVSVAFSKRAAKEHAARGQGYVAAPVFGRPEAAAAQKLWVVAAGPAETVERCRPLFEALGRGISVVGTDPSAANVVKLAGNSMIMAAIEAMGESFALAKASGVDPRQLLEVVNSALFQSPLYANYGAIIAEKRFEPPGFRLRLGLKDAQLVSAAADAVHVPMPLASLVRDRLLRAVAEGHGDIDWSAFSSL
ncbi:MAG TPA: NAD(P)-dependent oxidoreductase [Bryobacteraceae bacterium]|nr:NAD(P)-dependent oxidoreductase [Bryobacteraceae bacterium]